MMMENGEIESADDEMPSLGRQQYRPVVSHEGSAVQMWSMESGSLPEIPLKPIRTASHTKNAPNTLEGPSHGPDVPNNFPRESKLELFGFDSLVNILGLKSMTGEHVPTPTSLRDGDEVSVVLGSPKVVGPKSGTLMGVFVPCLQNILGIIYYIRFSWVEDHIISLVGRWDQKLELALDYASFLALQLLVL